MKRNFAKYSLVKTLVSLFSFHVQTESSKTGSLVLKVHNRNFTIFLGPHFRIQCGCHNIAEARRCGLKWQRPIIDLQIVDRRIQQPLESTRKINIKNRLFCKSSFVRSCWLQAAAYCKSSNLKQDNQLAIYSNLAHAQLAAMRFTSQRSSAAICHSNMAAVKTYQHSWSADLLGAAGRTKQGSAWESPTYSCPLCLSFPSVTGGPS
jgi:hypothetical protein